MVLLHRYRCVLILALSLYFVQLQVQSQQFRSCTTPSLENGIVKTKPGVQRVFNGMVKTKPGVQRVFFQCNVGFQRRLGAKFALCLKNGLWSKPPPKCIRKGCRAIHSNKSLRVKRKYKGAMLKFTCAAGLQRQGPEFIYCNGKKWNKENPPKCVVDIDLQCDFEDDNLCGWSQADNDQFEWTWFSGGTLSPDTGPQADHTFGSSDSGHFLYIEASGRKPNDTAILLSPLYLPNNSSLCFEFWYHMYGPDNAVGSLKVFVKPKSRKLYDLYPEFNEAGNQGPEWKRASLKIQQQTEVFQIVVVGTLKGKFHFQSDIAVDDFKLHNCTKDDPDAPEFNGFPETTTVESVIISQTKHKDTESDINPRTESYPGLTEDSETAVVLPTMAVHPFSTVSSAIPRQAVNSIRTSSDDTIVVASQTLSAITEDVKTPTQYERTGDPAIIEESALYLSLLIPGTTEFLTSEVSNNWNVREFIRPTMTTHTLHRGFPTSEHLQSQQYSHTSNTLTSSSAIAFSVSPSLSTTIQSTNLSTNYQRMDDLATIEEESLPLRISTTKLQTSSLENKLIASETFQPTRLMKTFNTIETSFHMTQTVRSVDDDLTKDPPKRQTGIIYKATPLSTNTASIIFHVPSSSYAYSIPQTVKASRPETNIEPFETIMPTNVLRTNLQPKHSTHSFSSKLAISSSLSEKPHQAASYSDLPVNNSIGEGSDLHEIEYGLTSTIDRLNTELVNKSEEFYNPEMRETISIATLSTHFIIILSCCIVLGLIIIAIASYIWAKREETLMLKYRCSNNQLQS